MKTVKNPEFERKINRDPDGRFAPKDMPTVESAAEQETYDTSDEYIRNNTPKNVLASQTENGSKNVESTDPDVYLKASYWTAKKLEEQEKKDDENFSKKIERQRSPESDALAKKHLDIARSKEPAITADVTSICTSAGGDMFGLDYRLKSESSLSGKINLDYIKQSKTRNKQKNMTGIAGNIKDNVRYTSVVSSDKLAKHVDTVLGNFQEKGYKVIKCKSTFKDSSMYKGVNCALTTPDGYTFELQFHTPESVNAKEQFVKRGNKWEKATKEEALSKYPSHKYYEELRARREEGKPVTERGRYLHYVLITLWSKVKTPKNLDKICAKYQ